ncbi:uncharacterized protein LOC117327389 [Pecten maximus]|uniref:uncharacterized protein LOC117327389 n=1 Tax=Pecten maximus TaxID=6579 RepID=UPI0014582F17|nr:uncharacterized protein LOC117327389 [Pecten maximus]
MMDWIFVYIWTLVCFYKGIQCTICSEAAASENTRVIRMCESGSWKTERVVIDTYDTGDPDVYSCTCTATQYITSSYLVSFGRAYSLQQHLNCGSRLSIDSSGKDSLSNECVWPDNVYTEKRSMLEFTLSRTNVNNPWRYGYCILLETDNTKWNITCHAPVKVTTKTLSSTTTTTTTTTTRTPQPTSTTIAASTGSGRTSSSMTPEVNTKQICLTQTVEVFSAATVVVPIVVVVLIAVVATIANVIIYRRRLVLDEKINNTDHISQPHRTVSVVYDTIDTDRLEPPHTYADTTAGRMYANTGAGVTVS